MAKARIALFIDVQNDFVKDGALAYGYPDEDIVPKIVRFAKECRDEGFLLAATRDTHFIDTYPATLEGRLLPVVHCVNKTYGWELVNGLRSAIPEELVFDKPTFGLLNLARHLNAMVMRAGYAGIEEIRICGGCSSICLAANAVILRAAYPDVHIVVEASLCFDVSKESHLQAMAVLGRQQIFIVG